jgi:hypothetical protein
MRVEDVARSAKNRGDKSRFAGNHVAEGAGLRY